MPQKSLVVMLCTIALFAIIDLARSAKNQLDLAFADSDVVTAVNTELPAPAAPVAVAPAAASKAGIMPATWNASALR